MPTLGGTQQFVFNLTNKLALAGHSVTVVTPEYDGNHRFINSDNVQLLRFPYKRTTGLVLLSQNSNCLKRVIAADRIERFDVLHQFHVVPLGMACVLLRRKLRKPLVTTLMGWDSYSPAESADMFYRVSRPVSSLVLNSSDVVTSPSRNLALHAHSAGYRRLIEVIPHAVDSDRFNDVRLNDQVIHLRANLGIATYDRLILTVSRLVRVKSVETIIRAAPIILQRNRHVKFVIAGDGPEYLYLLGLARTMNVDNHFRFVGRVSPAELPTYYAASDLFVLTSLYEAFGLVILEAMAAGKPVIATNVGAIPEIVDDRVTGFLISARDADKLAGLALYILGNEVLRAKMGSLGRQRVEKHFTWENLLRRYSRVYERLT
jgi:N-acetyl-alpha-D-glucosaminyl L-malate synthase BshA